MRTFGRSLLSIVAGALLAGVIILTVRGISDLQGLREFVKALPLGEFLFFLGAWASGTFAGAFLAASLAGRSPLGHALAVGVVFLLAGLANLLMLPHPVWFWVAGIAVFPFCSYLGGRCAYRSWDRRGDAAVSTPSN